jgi:apolipoprotein N-acyltransferase
MPSRILPALPLSPLAGSVLSAAGGAALALAYPEAGLWPLAFVSLTPLYLAAYRQAPRRAFLFGWIFGMSLGLSSFSWLAGVMSGYGGLGPWGGALILMILAAFLALYQGLFMWLCAGWDERGRGFLLNPVLAALWWTGLDWAKGWAMTGFNWTPLGGALASEPRLLGLADVLGACGLGFPVALANFLVAALLVMPRRERAMESVIAAAGALSCLMCVSLYGIIAFNIWEDEARAARRVRLAVLQPSVAQEFKWDVAYREEILKRLRGLALEGARSRPFLTVWPETSAPFVYGRDMFETAWIRRLLAEAGEPMLAGLAAGAPDGAPGSFVLRNRAWLLYPDGREGPYYDKQHLVPFGEYVPMIDRLPFLRSAFLQGVLGAAGNFSPGGRKPPLEHDGVSFGPLICFESIYPTLARRLAAAGADVLLVTTNDAWFGDSWAPSQHFAHAALRAAETRLPLARAANDGISGLILPSGRTAFRSRRGAVDVYQLDVPLAGRDSPTLYVRWGYLFAPLCGALAAASAACLAFMRARRRPSARKAGGGAGSRPEGAEARQGTPGPGRGRRRRRK